MREAKVWRQGLSCAIATANTLQPRSTVPCVLGATVKVVGYRSPNQNAYVERFVQAIERECLDKFIVFGREHLDHQAMGNRPLMNVQAATTATGKVSCRERLGRVLRHYHRALAA